MRVLKYSLEEAWASMRRSVRSVAVSVSTIAAALLVVAAFLLVWMNLRQLIEVWSTAAEMSVYLEDNVKDPDRSAIEGMLGDGDLITGREYLSKAEALSRFKEEFPDLAALATGASENPFPASFELRLKTGAGLSERTEALAGRLRVAPGVADVRYDRLWLDRLQSALRAVEWAGMIFGLVLIAGALVTVANVVKLALHARRQEIEIMELVGAPTAYVRGPFVLEGILQGGLGAIVALGLLWLGYAAGHGQYGDPVAQILGLPALRFLTLELCGALVLGGMLLGSVGGFVAARHTRSDRRMMESDVATS
jgi:cell division transport system permease protein